MNNPMFWVFPNGDIITHEEYKMAKLDVLGTLQYIWAEPQQQNVAKTFSGPKPKKNVKEELNYCVFCKNNKARGAQSHTAKDCPRLQAYTCPICNKNGHTVRYCPEKKIITPEDLAGRQ